MFGKKKPKAEARKFAGTLLVCMISSNLPRAFVMVSDSDGVSATVRQAALGGLLKAAAKLPKVQGLLEQRADTSSPIGQAAADALSYARTDPSLWGPAPTDVHMEVQLIEVSGAIALDDRGPSQLNDLQTSDFCWGKSS